MKRSVICAAALFAALAALAALNPVRHSKAQQAPHDHGAHGAAQRSEDRPVLYWRDPDGKPAYSPSPAKTQDGRDYVPVYQEVKDGPPQNAQWQKQNPKGERKIKFYRNPMGLPDTSPVPKKDSMGMDYIPVYEDEADDGGVTLSPQKIQRTGVRTEAVSARDLARPVNAPAVVALDERTIRDVTLRADSFIEQLYVAETGKTVKAGQPLFRAYTPEIVRAQVDFRTALPDRGNTGALDGAIQRLENLDVPKSVIDELKRGNNRPAMQIDWPAPAGGVVIEKRVIEGQRVEAGDLLYRIADLSKVWIIADVAEQDIGAVKIGDPAKIRFTAFPGEVFEAPVTFIMHELNMATRTAKVRIELPNPDYRILHDMFADVTIETGGEMRERLAIPSSAILYNGERRSVLVAKGEGRFEPRDVELGMRGDGYVEVTAGLKAGEEVVTSANFLIDAESSLKAALTSFTSPDEQSAKHGEQSGMAAP